MAGEIRITTEEVELSATTIESLNNKLNDKLLEAQNAVKVLGSTWQGEAYDATLLAFNNFANNYFETYKESIANYVEFLRSSVAQGYFKTETKNESLANQFK